MKLDKFGLVKKLEEEVYVVDSSLLNENDIYKYGNRKYFIGEIPGVTLSPQCWYIEYHEGDKSGLPQRLVAEKAIFRIVQRDNYEREGNILKEVHDQNLVRRILDKVVQRYELGRNQPKKHQRK